MATRKNRLNDSSISQRKRRALLSALLSGIAAPTLLTACGTSGDSETSPAVEPQNKAGKSIAANAANTNAVISLVVSSAPSGQIIDSSFSGLSYEKSYISMVSRNTLTAPPTSLFNASNTGLVNLFKRLGPSVLRIGGNSTDKMFWNPTGPPGLQSGQVSPSDIDRLAAFARATGWKIIYGINFVYNTPANVAAEAAYATASFGSSLIGFELGNEPDLYANTGNQVLGPLTITMNGQAQTFTPLGGIAQSQYTYANFLAQWNLCAQAVLAQVPSANLMGPASGVFPNPFGGGIMYDKGGTYTGHFAADAGKTISMLTQHYYLDGDLTTNGKPDWGIPAGSSSATITNWMLTPDPYLPAGLQAIATATKSVSGGFRMAEANIFYEGGIQGMTYSLATGLWAIDFLFINAQNGSKGVNFHSGFSGGTISASTNPVPAGETPISDDYTTNEGGVALPPGFSPIIDDLTQTVVGVGPEYYAMYLFSLAATGQLQNVAVTNPSGLLMSAYAVAGKDGSQYVMILNKDQNTTAQVTLQLNASASQATATVLASSLTGTATPSLQRGDSITLNGAPIDTGGGWNPAAPPTYPVTNGNMVSLNVGPASAVLLKAR
ncbi:MAG TPA: hypothetical protein VNW52_00240 [Burkholderiaceae bacterium]|jgi:hypothetical protein|nr:hypothetical protein [Burkholderiaceae bacterium]